MAQNDPGDQYSAALQSFCRECRKINFRKLSKITRSDICKQREVCIGHLPADTHLAQNKSITNCWLCSLRYMALGANAPKCSIYIENAWPERLSRFEILSGQISREIVIPSLHFKTREILPKAFALVSLRDTTSDLLSLSPVPPSLDVSFLQESIAFCHTNHEGRCDQPGQYVPGMKLIDCHTLEVIQSTGLVSYVTLSYVWGHERRRRIHKRSDGSLMLETLSQTVQDSLAATRLLGFRYLWVDKICIDQTNDSERHQ
jgi:hypothetical protein